MGATKRPLARSSKRWVRHVQETSNAMDLPRGIFTRSARGIATGLKRSVSRSSRTKGRSKFQSAMSMLNLHVNRSGRNLARADRTRLEAAKGRTAACLRPPGEGRGARESAAEGRVALRLRQGLSAREWGEHHAHGVPTKSVNSDAPAIAIA
jgi:hypothetical protein